MLRSLLARRALRPHCLIRRFYSVLASDSQIHVDALQKAFPTQWLRDSCPCPHCVHPSNRQKLHRSSDFAVPSSETVARSHSIDSGSNGPGLQVTWESGHESFYPLEYLARYSDPIKLKTFHRDLDPVPWSVPSLTESSTLFVSYASLHTPSGLLSAIDQLTRYGLLFVQDVPHEETSDNECELKALAGKFGDIRNTFYGEVWDVVSLKESKNIAYTNLDLGFHMDLLYFTHPPRYQILHCLRNRVRGGTSLFTDALYASHLIRSASPEHFDVLASVPVGFHYVNDGHHLHCEHPTIELDRFSSTSPAEKPNVKFINYSPPFQAPLPPDSPPQLYAALKAFHSTLSLPDNVFSHTLKKGEAVVFDNRRVLHARTAFEDIGGGGDGEVNRWLKGCYLEAEPVLDRGRVLARVS